MWAYIHSGTVIELTGTDPAGRFDASMVWVNTAGVSPAPQAGWTYDGTSFAAPVAPAVDMRPAAQAALDRSDVTVIRCYEHAVAVPAAWATYRGALRAIVAGGATSAALPTQPAFPAGS